MIRNLGNKLGLAWWAKVETGTPSATYWYGPFLTKSSLNENLEKLVILNNNFIVISKYIIK